MNALIPVFKALSDRNRLRVLAALSEHKELCACQVTELLQVAGATASRHLSLLISAGLVASRKDGRWVYYRLRHDRDAFNPVFEWMKNEFAGDQEIRKDKKRLAEITALDPEELCRKQRGEACCPTNQVS
jgi:ArsR family transcriptional regulator, arsenate/arsenite/antimonite-responsive transcriptional repressor